jgi:PAS domain S-box-containing protein
MIKDNQLYKILVVEDNPGDFVLVEEYISDSFLNTEITNVTSFKEFERTVSTSEDFDIVFLDLSLPDKSGIDLVKAVIAHNLLIPIVVLTGYTDFNFAIQSLSLGISDYLLKEDLSATTIYKCIVYNLERYKTLVKIKESEQRYSDVFQLSPNPLFVFDLETNKIIDVNNSAIEVYQYAMEEFLDIQIDNLQVDVNNRQNFDISINALEKDYQSIYKNIECHQKKNGEILYVLTKKNSFIYKGKESVILSVEDLTKEIIQIFSIQYQNKKLREIAWTQSHVVRAPVARIMGLIKFLTDESDIPLHQQELYDMILQSSNELDEVIRDIVSKTQNIQNNENSI